LHLALKIARSAFLVFAGIALSAFASGATTIAPQVLLLGASAVVFVLAFPRRVGVGLALAAFFALQGTREAAAGTFTVVRPFGVFQIAFLTFGMVGAFLIGSPRGLRGSSPALGLGCFLASVPVWAMGNLHAAFPLVATALVFVGLLLATLAPMLSGRGEVRAPRSDPIAAPCIEVAPREFWYDRGARWIKLLAGIAALIAVAGLVVAWTADTRPDQVAAAELQSGLGFTMAVAGTVISLTFLGCLWLNRRLSVRVDANGLHARRVFGEVSIPWSGIVALETSEVSVKYGVAYQFWDVLGRDRVIRFPDTIGGSADLRAVIEAATGLRWQA
jgi:hypothetical protein